MCYLTHVTSSRQQLTTTQVREIMKIYVISQGRPVCDGVLSLSERPKRTEVIATAESRPPKTSSDNGYAEQSRFGMYAQCLVATQLSDKVSATALHN